MKNKQLHDMLADRNILIGSLNEELLRVGHELESMVSGTPPAAGSFWKGSPQGKDKVRVRPLPSRHIGIFGASIWVVSDAGVAPHHTRRLRRHHAGSLQRRHTCLPSRCGASEGDTLGAL